MRAAIERHRRGDWGHDYIGCPIPLAFIAPDRAAALEFGGRLTSRYKTASGAEFMVTTDRYRTSTIVYLPHEK